MQSISQDGKEWTDTEDKMQINSQCDTDNHLRLRGGAESNEIPSFAEIANLIEKYRVKSNSKELKKKNSERLPIGTVEECGASFETNLPKLDYNLHYHQINEALRIYNQNYFAYGPMSVSDSLMKSTHGWIPIVAVPRDGPINGIPELFNESEYSNEAVAKRNNDLIPEKTIALTKTLLPKFLPESLLQDDEIMFLPQENPNGLLILNDSDDTAPMITDSTITVLTEDLPEGLDVKNYFETGRVMWLGIGSTTALEFAFSTSMKEISALVADLETRRSKAAAAEAKKLFITNKKVIGLIDDTIGHMPRLAQASPRFVIFIYNVNGIHWFAGMMDLEMAVCYLFNSLKDLTGNVFEFCNNFLILGEVIKILDGKRLTQTLPNHSKRELPALHPFPGDSRKSFRFQNVPVIQQKEQGNNCGFFTVRNLNLLMGFLNKVSLFDSRDITTEITDYFDAASKEPVDEKQLRGEISDAYLSKIQVHSYKERAEMLLKIQTDARERSQRLEGIARELGEEAFAGLVKCVQKHLADNDSICGIVIGIHTEISSNNVSNTAPQLYALEAKEKVMIYGITNSLCEQYGNVPPEEFSYEFFAGDKACEALERIYSNNDPQLKNFDHKKVAKEALKEEALQVDNIFETQKFLLSRHPGVPKFCVYTDALGNAYVRIGTLRRAFNRSETSRPMIDLRINGLRVNEDRQVVGPLGDFAEISLWTTMLNKSEEPRTIPTATFLWVRGKSYWHRDWDTVKYDTEESRACLRWPQKKIAGSIFHKPVPRSVRSRSKSPSKVREPKVISPAKDNSNFESNAEGKRYHERWEHNKNEQETEKSAENVEKRKGREGTAENQDLKKNDRPKNTRVEPPEYIRLRQSDDYFVRNGFKFSNILFGKFGQGEKLRRSTEIIIGLALLCIPPGGFYKTGHFHHHHRPDHDLSRLLLIHDNITRATRRINPAIEFNDRLQAYGYASIEDRIKPLLDEANIDKVDARNYCQSLRDCETILRFWEEETMITCSLASCPIPSNPDYGGIYETCPRDCVGVTELDCDRYCYAHDSEHFPPSDRGALNYNNWVVTYFRPVIKRIVQIDDRLKAAIFRVVKALSQVEESLPPSWWKPVRFNNCIRPSLELLDHAFKRHKLWLDTPKLRKAAIREWPKAVNRQVKNDIDRLLWAYRLRISRRAVSRSDISSNIEIARANETHLSEIRGHSESQISDHDMVIVDLETFGNSSTTEGVTILQPEAATNTSDEWDKMEDLQERLGESDETSLIDESYIGEMRLSDIGVVQLSDDITSSLPVPPLSLSSDANTTQYINQATPPPPPPKLPMRMQLELPTSSSRVGLYFSEPLPKEPVHAPSPILPQLFQSAFQSPQNVVELTSYNVSRGLNFSGESESFTSLSPSPPSSSDSSLSFHTAKSPCYSEVSPLPNSRKRQRNTSTSPSINKRLKKTSSSALIQFRSSPESREPLSPQANPIRRLFPKTLTSEDTANVSSQTKEGGSFWSWEESEERSSPLKAIELRAPDEYHREKNERGDVLKHAPTRGGPDLGSDEITAAIKGIEEEAAIGNSTKFESKENLRAANNLSDGYEADAEN